MLQARAIYNIFDLLGDLGGVSEVLGIVFGALLLPISEHSFIMDAMKRFFFARTEDEDLFAEEEDEAMIKMRDKYLDEANFPDDLGDDRKEEIVLHRHIHLSVIDNIFLYLSNQLGCFFPCFCWSKREKLQRLYEKSNDQIDKELDLIKVVKNMKSFRVFLKNFLMTEKIKFEIAHSFKNCIDIDTDSDEEDLDILDQIDEEVRALKLAKAQQKKDRA